VMAAKKTVARGYGANHKRLRQLVGAEGRDRRRLVCPLRPPDRSRRAWDLGHVDHDRSRYAGPEHRRCNRSTASRRCRALQTAPPQTVPVDDPGNGVFWGPSDASGNYRRWSRAWFEWR
jgi:hypothetical protein